jgi:hypothetical protein
MPRHVLPLHVRVVDVFAVRDYTYLVSAILMLAGAFRLMQIPVASADLFQHTLFVFAILAAYELLLLGAAVLVMRALHIPDQARLLSLIALSLALDPTFFNQSFATFHNLGNDWGLIINVVILGLLPLKAWIIWRFSNAPFSPRLLVAYLLAGSLVYLSPLVFLDKNSLSTRSQCFAVLVWAPLLIAWCTPSQKKQTTERQTFLTALTLIASGIVFLHLFNIGNVYLETVSLGRFHPRKYPGLFIVAPIILTSNLLQLRLKARWEGAINHRQWLAIGPILAALCAIPSSPDYHIALGGLTLSPLHLTVIVSMLILWRVSLIPGCRYYRYAAILLGVLPTLGYDLETILETLDSGSFMVPGIYLWLVLLVPALRKRKLSLFLIVIATALWGILHRFESLTPTTTIQIIGWGALSTVLAWNRGWRKSATVISLAMFLHILFVLLHSPSADTSHEVYAWAFAVLIAAGSLLARSAALRELGFAPLALLGVKMGWPLAVRAVGALVAWLNRWQARLSELPPGTFLVLLAFLVFGLAIWFSFRRKSLADWVEKREVPSLDNTVPTSPVAPAVEKSDLAHPEP